MNTKYKFYLVFVSMATLLVSCTKLDSELRNELSADQAKEFVDNNGTDLLVRDAYLSMKPAYIGFNVWALQEFSTDELLIPTRGADWGDGNRWIELHTHTWTPDHATQGEAFSNLLKIVFKTTNALSFNLATSDVAQMKFLRAVAVGSVLDLWGQVPIRKDLGDLLSDPEVLNAEEAFQFIVDEVTPIISDLPDGPTTVANKDAAKAFLMKMYLNKGAFLTPENPTFDSSDLDKVISLADEIITTGKYNINCNFFNNFTVNNDVSSCENIWTLENEQGDPTSGPQRILWLATLNQKQGPSGWNGFTTLSDFYDSFESNDERLYYREPTNFDAYGLNLGILIGQQIDGDGNNLEDGLGNPLVYTRDLELINNGPDQRVKGLRILKYNIDVDQPDNPDNDYVMFRYSRVLFMKAEAMFRKGDVPGATAIINSIRNARGLADLTSALDEDQFLVELGHEFYVEGHRRTDMIRFGKFLDPFQLKPATDDPKYLKFAIPATQVTANANLDQNPGY